MSVRPRGPGNEASWEMSGDHEGKGNLVVPDNVGYLLAFGDSINTGCRSPGSPSRAESFPQIHPSPFLVPSVFITMPKVIIFCKLWYLYGSVSQCILFLGNHGNNVEEHHSLLWLSVDSQGCPVCLTVPVERGCAVLRFSPSAVQNLPVTLFSLWAWLPQMMCICWLWCVCVGGEGGQREAAMQMLAPVLSNYLGALTIGGVRVLQKSHPTPQRWRRPRA